ncbi:MAG TPA: isoprenylcysteine carboxylmethyltransferase family protein [Pirellulaceae bacterium]|nr:isoprenylcysteine carboxylmethyltransferase family protein [Pirellulaceae bacterium]
MPRVHAYLRAILFPVFAGGIIFVAAGRVDLPAVWGVLALLGVFMVGMVTVADPGMIRERVQPGPGSQDRFTQPASIVLLLAHWLVAGLDVGRFQWSPVPPALQIAGLIGYAACLAFVMWCLRVNRFYSSVVRVQSDRGHEPITVGPYAIVRHPGYAASIVAVFCGGVALGSWLAMIPVAAFVLLFVRRTLLEDAMLVRELPGYAGYAKTVRYRLLPGVF